MAATLAQMLCMRLQWPLDTLRRLQWLDEDACYERATWGRLDCLWLACAAPQAHDERSVLVDSFREEAEALVPLNVLANVDWEKCQGFVHDLTQLRTRWMNPSDDSSDPPTVVGLAYRVRHPDDFSPISERVFGLQAPSDEYVDEYSWFKNELAALGGDARYAFQPIPIRIHLELEEPSNDQGAYVLRQIAQCAVAQSLYTHESTEDVSAEAAASVRFQIRELRIDPSAAASVEALDALAKLMGLGVYVPHLPPLSSDQYAPGLQLSAVRSLRALLHTPISCGRLSSIDTVHATDFMAGKTIPCLFSAIAFKSSIESFELHALRDPAVAVPEGLWEWMAFALFSSHAESSVKHVTLDAISLTASALESMELVLSAQDPLAVLFGTAVENDVWVETDQFHLEHPDDVLSAGNATVFRTAPDMAACVRVIDRCVRDTASWCRVLLPGCGQAWVKHTELVTSDNGEQEWVELEELMAMGADTFSPARSLLDLNLHDVVPIRVNETLSMIRLVGHRLRSLVLSTNSPDYQVVDMTEWLQEVLHVCPRLERLELSENAEIHHLREIVEAAEAGNCRLRSLSLLRYLPLDSSDIVQFLNVLCDAHHPLTKQLDELCLNGSVDTIDEFRAAWQRFLERNRTLHTITLSIWSPNAQRLEAYDAQVAIRSGSLEMTSKLAFLRFVHDASRTGRASGRLDTSVIAIIFAFAAQHRIREVAIYRGG